MSAGSPPLEQIEMRSMRFVVGVVLATIAALAVLFAAAAAGLLPNAPTYAGADPAMQYLSPQTIGERAADQ